ncbi:hypothetical protein [Pradoshia eiseniae]|uniref:hypothetical protein n=1 Tax=Pradoshia eiseniae TaxID=2064768 RepID=UPI0013752D5D|nr:hypothetical protein [Pradoshia eiseniae]
MSVLRMTGKGVIGRERRKGWFRLMDLSTLNLQLMAKDFMALGKLYELCLHAH